MADERIHAPLAISSAAVLMPVCSIIVGLRMYARVTHGTPLGIDDWTILIALLCAIGMGVTIIVEVHLRNLGYAVTDPRKDPAGPSPNVAWWPVQLLQVPALGFAKLSFIFFYRRIFIKPAAKRFNLITWSMIVIIVVWTVAFFFALLFICGTHFSTYWASLSEVKERCVNTSMLHNALAISDVIIDVPIVVLPIPIIWRLQLSIGRKIGISAVFLTGALSIAASIVRLVILLQLTAETYSSNVDLEFEDTAGLYWNMIESGLAVVAASLPALYGLFKPRKTASGASYDSKLSYRSIASTKKPRKGSERLGQLEPEHSETNFTTSAEGMSHDDKSLEMRPLPDNAVRVTRSFEIADGLDASAV